MGRGDFLVFLCSIGFSLHILVIDYFSPRADGVLICRPFVTAAYGGGQEGVKELIGRLAQELSDTMAMCGAHSLSEITSDMIIKP